MTIHSHHDTLTEIFSYLAAEDLTKVALVCKSWKKAALSDLIFKPICEKKFPESCKKQWVILHAKARSWNSVYGILTGTKFTKKALWTYSFQKKVYVFVKENLFIAGCEHAVKVWNLFSGELISKLEFPNSQEVYTLKCLWVGFRNSDVIVLTNQSDKILNIWNVTKNTRLNTINKKVYAAELNENVLVLGLSINIEISNLDSDECTTLSGHTSYIRKLLLEGELLYSASDDTTIKVWNIKKKECLSTLEKHEDAVLTIAIEGDILVSGGSDGKVIVWDKISGNYLKELEGHKGAVDTICIQNDFVLSADSSSVIEVGTSVLHGSTFKLVDIKGDVIQNDLQNQEVEDLKNNVNLWDLKTGKCLKKYFHHNTLGGIGMQGTVIFINDQLKEFYLEPSIQGFSIKTVEDKNLKDSEESRDLDRNLGCRLFPFL